MLYIFKSILQTFLWNDRYIENRIPLSIFHLFQFNQVLFRIIIEVQLSLLPTCIVKFKFSAAGLEKVILGFSNLNHMALFHHLIKFMDFTTPIYILINLFVLCTCLINASFVYC